MIQHPVIVAITKAVAKASYGLLRDFGEIGQLRSDSDGAIRFTNASTRRTKAILFETLYEFNAEYPFLMEHNEIKHADMEESESPYSEDFSVPTWIINPLDGMKNFSRGLPYFGISVALRDQDRIVAGVIYDPLRNELFWSYLGKGAFLNQQRIRVFKQTHHAASLVAASTSGLKHHPKMVEAIGKLGISGLRTWGCTCMDMAYVAAGRWDAFWEGSARPANIAAGALIIKESGGFVTDEKGRGNFLVAKHIIAGSEYMHRLLIGQSSVLIK